MTSHTRRLDDDNGFIYHGLRYHHPCLDEHGNGKCHLVKISHDQDFDWLTVSNTEDDEEICNFNILSCSNQQAIIFLLEYVSHIEAAPEKLEDTKPLYDAEAVTGFAFCFWDWSGDRDEDGDAPYIEVRCFPDDNENMVFYARWYGIEKLKNRYGSRENLQISCPHSLERMPVIEDWEKALEHFTSILSEYAEMPAKEFGETYLADSLYTPNLLMK